MIDDFDPGIGIPAGYFLWVRVFVNQKYKKGKRTREDVDLFLSGFHAFLDEVHLY